MKTSKYNVILMRDDTSVKNFRLSPFWIKSLLVLFLLLLVTSIAGIYYSRVYYVEHVRLAELYEEKALSYAEMKRELKRLQNVEKMFKSYNEEELRTFLTVQPQAVQDPSAQDVDLADLFEPVDIGVVGISNVQASFANNRMRVQLEINNMEGDGTISGRVFLYLVMNDGEIIDLNLEDRDLYYAIARFKRVDTSFELPEGVSQDSIFAIRIRAADDDDNTIYSETFPISTIIV